MLVVIVVVAVGGGVGQNGRAQAYGCSLIFVLVIDWKGRGDLWHF